jgi:hypothetical protein
VEKGHGIELPMDIPPNAPPAFVVSLETGEWFVIAQSRWGILPGTFRSIRLARLVVAILEEQQISELEAFEASEIDEARLRAADADQYLTARLSSAPSLANRDDVEICEVEIEVSTADTNRQSTPSILVVCDKGGEPWPIAYHTIEEAYEGVEETFPSFRHT